MARMPKCVGCEKFDFFTRTCNIYPDRIPTDIFVEKEDCKYYKIKETEFERLNDDLPIAKGR